METFIITRTKNLFLSQVCFLMMLKYYQWVLPGGHSSLSWWCAMQSAEQEARATGTWQLHHTQNTIFPHLIWLSWPHTTFLVFFMLPTLPAWLLVISGCFSSWIFCWKEPDLRHQQTLCKTWWPSYTPFTKRPSKNASNNARTAGTSVCSPKKNTLKKIRVSNLHVTTANYIFPCQMFNTFF